MPVDPFVCIFSSSFALSLLFILFCDGKSQKIWFKRWKQFFQQSNRVQSTRSLVKIHNTCCKPVLFSFSITKQDKKKRKCKRCGENTHKGVYRHLSATLKHVWMTWEQWPQRAVRTTPWGCPLAEGPPHNKYHYSFSSMCHSLQL